MIFWYKGSTFILPNNTQKNGQCSFKNGYYWCEIYTVILNYEPEQRWLTLGYLCGEQKYMHGLHFEYKAKAKKHNRM